MSLEDLKQGSYTTGQLLDGIELGLDDIAAIAEADEKHGRLEQAQKKRWLVDAVREYIRITTNALGRSP